MASVTTVEGPLISHIGEGTARLIALDAVSTVTSVKGMRIVDLG